MKIKKVQFKNGYKRFHNLIIDLGPEPKRIIALVGPNGCGKSCVFDGMLYLNNAYHRLGNKGKKDFEYHSLHNHPNFSYENIILEFDKGLFSEVQGNKKMQGKSNTIFSFRSPYRYNNVVKINQIESTEDIKLNKYGASASSDIDDKMNENYKLLYVKYNRYLNDENCRPSEAKEKIIGELNSSLKNCLDLEISSIGDIQASKGTLYFKKG